MCISLKVQLPLLESAGSSYMNFLHNKKKKSKRNTNSSTIASCEWEETREQINMGKDILIE